jgi:hypothetical protein
MSRVSILRVVPCQPKLKEEVGIKSSWRKVSVLPGSPQPIIFYAYDY